MEIDYTLYLCTDRTLLNERKLEEVIEQAIKGGCSVVQLREKECSTREFLKIAKAVKIITDKYSVPLIINDRIDIMLAVDASGVHLGQDDMPVAEARKLIGEEKMIGCSAHNLEEAKKAYEEGADYLGVGAIFGTKTKKDTVNTSIETLTEICNNIDIPVVAIGGVNFSNIENLIGTGIKGVAVVSAIIATDDSEIAAKSMRNKLGEVL